MPQVWLAFLLAGALKTDLLLLLLKTLPCSGPGGLPFSVYEFGDAELAPAGGVGALDGRVAGNVIAHVLHQLLQLGACGEEEGVRPGCHVPWSLISGWGWVKTSPGSGQDVDCCRVPTALACPHPAGNVSLVPARGGSRYFADISGLRGTQPSSLGCRWGCTGTVPGLWFRRWRK